MKRPIRCEKCQDHGFLNCPEAITDKGDLIAKAFNQADPCDCEEGAWFRAKQLEWNNRVYKPLPAVVNPSAL